MRTYVNEYKETPPQNCTIQVNEVRACPTDSTAVLQTAKRSIQHLTG